MAVLTLGILLVPAKTSKAAGGYKYGTFAVTALSSTEVTIDYRNELEEYSGATVYGFDIYAEDLTLETGEILIRQAAVNEVFGTLTGLTPGHTYQVIVKAHYQYLGSDADYGYSFVQFTTPLSGVSSEVDVVTDSGISAPVTDPSAGQPSVPQPQIRKTATKLNKNSINLKWDKVSDAKNYTIYMRKRGSGKWYKVKTVSSKKASYKITKFRGKGLNTHRQNYDVKVKATAKIGGKTYSSTTNDYIYTYTYTRYR